LLREWTPKWTPSPASRAGLAAASLGVQSQFQRYTPGPPIRDGGDEPQRGGRPAFGQPRPRRRAPIIALLGWSFAAARRPRSFQPRCEWAPPPLQSGLAFHSTRPATPPSAESARSAFRWAPT